MAKLLVLAGRDGKRRRPLRCDRCYDVSAETDVDRLCFSVTDTADGLVFRLSRVPKVPWRKGEMAVLAEGVLAEAEGGSMADEMP